MKKNRNKIPQNQDEIKPKNPVGCPSDYTPELAQRICEIVSTHPMGIKKMRALYDFMPAIETINLWRMRHKDFADQYTQALTARANILAENAVEISENISSYYDKDSVERVDMGMIKHAQLKIATIQWTSAKMQPKTWGQNTITLEDGTEKEKIVAQVIERRKLLDVKNKKEF